VILRKVEKRFARERMWCLVGRAPVSGNTHHILPFEGLRARVRSRRPGTPRPSFSFIIDADTDDTRR